jgi:hygromycin-B 4-O-kinase
MWDKHGQGSHDSWKAFLLDVKKDSSISITHGWFENLKNSGMGTTLFDELYEKLEQLIDQCPEVRELIHSDLLNFNVMVKKNKISAVIDWQCAMYGDSLYDVAWFLYYAPWYPQFEAVKLREKLLSNFTSNGQSVSHIEERLQCYFLHIGLGSIAYNAFKHDWPAAEQAGEYTGKIYSDHQTH